MFLAEGFLFPGAELFCMVWVYSRQELLAALTFIVDAGGVPVPATEGARPVSCVTRVSAVTSVPDTCGQPKRWYPLSRHHE